MKLRFDATPTGRDKLYNRNRRSDIYDNRLSRPVDGCVTFSRVLSSLVSAL